jgi:hypothetical protein
LVEADREATMYLRGAVALTLSLPAEAQSLQMLYASPPENPQYSVGLASSEREFLGNRDVRHVE